MLKIAITGGAGSGKSTVARMFHELGAPLLDADAAAKEAVAVGTPAWEELRRAFGEEYFNPDGALNRAKISQLVFTDPEARQRLNDIVHPRVKAQLQSRLEELEQQGADLVMVEVPLLFEAGLAAAYDRVVVVYVDPEDQIRRLQDRDGRGAIEIAGILRAQLPLSDKADQADFVVDDRGSIEDTRSQVEAIWRKLQELLGGGEK
ncbi:MAG: dephospho-CoA kinase [Deltaproteobacteria bacterium]|nr:dephospho-CoA kinase [Deltaproteobacteria bacterium]